MESFTSFEDVVKELPKKVHDHLIGLAKETKTPESKKTKIKLIEAWLLKRALFDKMIDHEEFKKTDSMQKNDPSGCIALTLSGSIVSIGPLTDNVREIDYTSIGMRTDVPESLHVEKGNLSKDIVCEKPIHFTGGKLEKTSAIIDLAVTSTEKAKSAQTSSLKKVSKKLLTNFIQLNKDALDTKENKKALKNRNDLFSKWIIIQWFLTGGIARHIFMARAKILWLELFTKVYESLYKKIDDEEKLNEFFLEFTNARFGKFIDDYKWYESERKDFDIGLMKALEELPEYPVYMNFREDFSNSLQHTS